MDAPPNPQRIFFLAAFTAALFAGCGGAPESLEEAVDGPLAEDTLELSALANCAIRTVNGEFLTATKGGGLKKDAIRTIAQDTSEIAIFTLIRTPEDSTRYALMTRSGNYVTAAGGGGVTVNAIQTDRTIPQDWEKFWFVPLGAGKYAIRTASGYYWKAMGGGGHTTNAIATDATVIDAWETFSVACWPL